MNKSMAFTHLSDSALLQQIDGVLGSRRRLTATLLEYLAEVERRRLHLKEAYSSMYDFCVRKLYLGESSAVRHIAAARACSQFPAALDLIRQGQLNLTGLELISRHLKAENYRELLLAASGLRKPEIEAMLRSHFPRPDVPESVRPVVRQHDFEAAGARDDGASHTYPPSTPGQIDGLGGGVSRKERGRVAPLSETRYHVEFTTTAQCRDKLERALDLMSHQNPRRSVAFAFEHALDSLLRDLEKSKLGKTERPRKSRGTKHGDISRSARREVFERDGQQCTYVSESGARCNARAFLEMDHTQARALGGSGEAENLGVLCRPHNQFRAEQAFGKKYIQSRIHRRPRRLDVQKTQRDAGSCATSPTLPESDGSAPHTTRSHIPESDPKTPHPTEPPIAARPHIPESNPTSPHQMQPPIATRPDLPNSARTTPHETETSVASGGSADGIATFHGETPFTRQNSVAHETHTLMLPGYKVATEPGRESTVAPVARSLLEETKREERARGGLDRTLMEKLYLALTTMGFRATETKAALVKLGRRRPLEKTDGRSQRPNAAGNEGATLQGLLREALSLLSR